MTTLLIATRNRHKTDEIRAILGAEVQCLTLNDFPGAPPLVEDAATFAGNAARKAEQLAAWLASRPDLALRFPAGGFVMADDSGLEVDALNGAPGVFSARFAAMDAGAGGNSSDADNNAKLLRLLADVPLVKRTARFRCALAVVGVHSPSAVRRPQIFDGACEGRISFTPSGQGGFGYDPLFVPDGFAQSFADQGEEVKNRLSHRAHALARLREWLQKQPRQGTR